MLPVITCSASERDCADEVWISLRCPNLMSHTHKMHTHFDMNRYSSPKNVHTAHLVIVESQQLQSQFISIVCCVPGLTSVGGLSGSVTSQIAL